MDVWPCTGARQKTVLHAASRPGALLISELYNCIRTNAAGSGQYAEILEMLLISLYGRRLGRTISWRNQRMQMERTGQRWKFGNEQRG